MNKTELIDRIHAVWHDGDEFALSVAIIELLAKLPESNHIPMARFLALARENSLTSDPFLTHRVVQYLSGADSPVLDIGAELIEDDEAVYRLRDDELHAAVNHQLNPITGEIDATLKERIFVFFYPTDFIRRVFAEDGRV